MLSLNEWKKTFGNDLLSSFGPVHLWLKCVNNIIRGLLFVQQLSTSHYSRRDDTALYNELNWDFNSDNFKLTLNGHRVDLIHSRMPWPGGDHLTAVSTFTYVFQNHSMTAIDVKINDWHLWHKIRKLKHLNLSTVTKKKRDIAISVNFADKDNEIDFLKSIEQHFNYHHGLLNFHRYHILVREYEIERLQSIPFIVEKVNEGILKIFIKPSYLPEVERHSFRFQAIYENLMLLYHWQENIDLIVIDLDEFLIINSKDALKSLTDGSSSCVAVNRKHVSCQNCSIYYPDKELVLRSNYSQNWRSCSGDTKFDYSKLMVNPDKTNCMYVHWPACGTVCEKASESNLYILHLINYFGFRSSRLLNRLNYAPMDISSFTSLYSKYNNRSIDPLPVNESAAEAHLIEAHRKRTEEEQKSLHESKKKRNKIRDESKKQQGSVAEKFCVDFDFLTQMGYKGGITSEKLYTCPYPDEEKSCRRQSNNKEIEQIKEAELSPSEVLIFINIGKNQVDDVPSLYWWIDILSHEETSVRVTSNIVIVGDDCDQSPIPSTYNYDTLYPGSCLDGTSRLVKSLKDKYPTINFHLTRIKSEHNWCRTVFGAKAIYNTFEGIKYFIKVDPDRVLLPMNLKDYLLSFEATVDNRFPVSFGSQTVNPDNNEERILYGMNNPAMKISRLAVNTDMNLLLSKRSTPFIHCGGFIERGHSDFSPSEW